MVALKFHQYQVVGRALPKDAEDTPKIYRMKLWHTNDVRAKSKFWYFLKKVKKSNGQIVAINEILEKKPTVVENYGIWLRYQSRTGYHNMYKEYRDTTLNGAVDQKCTEMASRHRVRFPCIQIIETATIPAKLCKRESTKQFHYSKIKFPLNSDDAFMSDYVRILILVSEQVQSGKAFDKLLFAYFPFLGFGVLAILHGLLTTSRTSSSMIGKRPMLGRKKKA